MKFYARILAYFRPDVTLIVALIILINTALVVSMLLAWPLPVLTDSILSDEPRPDIVGRALLRLLPENIPGQVFGLAVIWLVLKGIENLVNLLVRVMVNNRLRYNGTTRVRAELFDKLQQLSPAYHRARPQGDSIYRLTIDAQGFFGVFDTFVGAANSLVTLIVITSLALWKDMRMTAVILCVAPLLVLVNMYFSRTIRRTSLASKQADSEVTTFSQRAMSAVWLTQLFGRQHYESRRFLDTILRAVRAGMRMNWQEALYPLTVQMTQAVAYAAILGFGGWLVWHDRANLSLTPFTVGTILIFISFLDRLFEPLSRIAGFTAAVQTNAAACARVFHVLDLEPTVADPPTAQQILLKPRTLHLKDVRFDYGEQPVLRGINVTITPGQMVAFVGQSGAGKSTLLNLLPRFYDPTGGSITLDGKDLRELFLDDVRRHVALVPQDSTLLPVPIGENIAYGSPAATPAEIAEAARLAGADEFIEQLPAGYDTVLGEHAVNLSGGQRQRLAIARALLTPAPILVLDEPTSALDGRHEQHVMRTLQSMKGRRTVILVTHRIETAIECDEIFVLDSGQIVEQGTHEELIRRKGVYAAMAQAPGMGMEPPTANDPTAAA